MRQPLRTVVTIGTFDGVHIGHAALLRRARELAGAGGGPSRVIAMCFDPHPLTHVNPALAPPRLTTFAHRSRLLGQAGADEIVKLEPSPGLLALAPEAFVDHVAKELSPFAIVEGPDFRFGCGRSGDVRTLDTLGSQRGFAVHIVPPVEVVMTDCTIAAASSTLARWLVGEGRIRDAAAVLGRNYEIDGVVVRGERRGRALGFPTANIQTECLMPGDGVYGGVALLPDGREVPAAISIGTKPMFDGTSRILEAHLLGAPDLSGMPDYGWSISVRFTRWLRDQMRFSSIEDLKHQIERDCRRVHECPVETGVA